MTWPRNKPWKAFAPQPSSEAHDDAEAALDYEPNGDMRGRYNLGWGCRWISRQATQSPNPSDDDPT